MTTLFAPPSMVPEASRTEYTEALAALGIDPVALERMWQASPASASAAKDRDRKYDPNQPRDEHGRWGEGGGGASAATTYQHTDYASQYDAGEALSKAFPKTTFSFDHMSTAAANGVSRAFANIQQRCPGFLESGQVRWVGSSLSAGDKNYEYIRDHGAVALTTKGDSVIFNDQIMRDPGAAARFASLSGDDGWWPKGCGTWEGMATHELGHAYRNWANSEGASDVLIKSDLRHFDQAYPPDSSLSRYGRTNASENWAEAFSAAYTSTSGASQLDEAMALDLAVKRVTEDVATLHHPPAGGR